MDVVAFTGTGANTTVNHNLKVVPELIIFKQRDTNINNWRVYNASDGAGYRMQINTNDERTADTAAWNNTTPTDSVFSLGSATYTNKSGADYIAYLFATLDGVSKVGSVVHSGTTNVNCGFSNGARFVLAKRTDATGDWYLWDSVRGIVSGNDPYFFLNTTDAHATGTDYIDPLSSGFTLSDDFTDGTYIFLAIA